MTISYSSSILSFKFVWKYYSFLSMMIIQQNFSSIHASPSSYISSDTNILSSSSSSFLAKRGPTVDYEKLPPIVFTPEGRLVHVENVAKASFDSNDSSSSLVIVFPFGSSLSKTIIFTVGAASPYPIIGGNNFSFTSNNTDSIPNDHNNLQEMKHVFNHNPQSISQQLHTIPNFSIIPSSSNSQNSHFNAQYDKSKHANCKFTIIATGGNVIDATILHRRILELSLVQSYNHCIQGKMSYLTTTPSILARKVADMVQSSTQTLGGKLGRMLASSAIIIGLDDDTVDNSNDARHTPKVKLWRIDTTGQFWDCSVASVGRGAGIVEMAFLQHVNRWKQSKREETTTFEYNDDYTDDLSLLVTNQDIRNFLASLSFEDAVILACECILRVLKISKNPIKSNLTLLERHRIHGLLLRSQQQQELNPQSQNYLFTEIIHNDILRQAFHVALDKTS